MWHWLEPLLPQRERRFRNRGGWMALSDRKGLCGTLYVLRAGIRR